RRRERSERPGGQVERPDVALGAGRDGDRGLTTVRRQSNVAEVAYRLYDRRRFPISLDPHETTILVPANVNEPSGVGHRHFVVIRSATPPKSHAILHECRRARCAPGAQVEWDRHHTPVGADVHEPAIDDTNWRSTENP